MEHHTEGRLKGYYLLICRNKLIYIYHKLLIHDLNLRLVTATELAGICWITEAVVVHGKIGEREVMPGSDKLFDGLKWILVNHFH